MGILGNSTPFQPRKLTSRKAIAAQRALSQSPYVPGSVHRASTGGGMPNTSTAPGQLPTATNPGTPNRPWPGDRQPLGQTSPNTNVQPGNPLATQTRIPQVGPVSATAPAPQQQNPTRAAGSQNAGTWMQAQQQQMPLAGQGLWRQQGGSPHLTNIQPVGLYNRPESYLEARDKAMRIAALQHGGVTSTDAFGHGINFPQGTMQEAAAPVAETPQQTSYQYDGSGNQYGTTSQAMVSGTIDVGATQDRASSGSGGESDYVPVDDTRGIDASTGQPYGMSDQDWAYWNSWNRHESPPIGVGSFARVDDVMVHPDGTIWVTKDGVSEQAGTVDDPPPWWDDYRKAVSNQSGPNNAPNPARTPQTSDPNAEQPGLSAWEEYLQQALNEQGPQFDSAAFNQSRLAARAQTQSDLAKRMAAMQQMMGGQRISGTAGVGLLGQAAHEGNVEMMANDAKYNLEGNIQNFQAALNVYNNKIAMLKMAVQTAANESDRAQALEQLKIQMGLQEDMQRRLLAYQNELNNQVTWKDAIGGLFSLGGTAIGSAIGSRKGT